jgi:D-3-phosphoglycerate dehydrogenase
MNILHVDTNHPLLIEQLEALGHYNVVDISSSKSVQKVNSREENE